MKNVLTPLAKIILIPLGLTAAASETYTVTQKKIFGSRTTASIISNEDMEHIIKIELRLLIKLVSKTIKNETKEQKGGFIQILLGALAASKLGNALRGKGLIRAGEWETRAIQNF